MDAAEFTRGLLLAIDATNKGLQATAAAIIVRLLAIGAQIADDGTRDTVMLHLETALYSQDGDSRCYHLRLIGRRTCAPNNPAFALGKTKRLRGRGAWLGSKWPGWQRYIMAEPINEASDGEDSK